MAGKRKNNNREIWNRSQQNEKWDDTPLIKAYDLAISRAKEKLFNRSSKSANSLSKNAHYNKKKSKGMWKIGDFCRAVFSEDGEMYEAVIKDINGNGEQCVVEFIGYGNEEEVDINSIRPSYGKSVQSKQKEIAKNVVPEMDNENDNEEEESSIYSESESYSSSRKNRNSDYYNRRENSRSLSRDVSRSDVSYESDRAPLALKNGGLPPPPPPMPFPANRDVMDDEVLASMLMSWYMAGYHTGFYQGRAFAQNTGARRHAHSHCHHCH